MKTEGREKQGEPETAGNVRPIKKNLKSKSRHGTTSEEKSDDDNAQQTRNVKTGRPCIKSNEPAWRPRKARARVRPRDQPMLLVESPPPEVPPCTTGALMTRNSKWLRMPFSASSRFASRT